MAGIFIVLGITVPRPGVTDGKGVRMTKDLQSAAMKRFHERFDPAQYSAVCEQVRLNLHAVRDDDRVIASMNALQAACLELCEHPDFGQAWHHLAIFCGQNSLSFHTVDAILSYLRRFSSEDVRIHDLECTAKAMLCAYSGQNDLKTAISYANGVHSWQGRMAYELLAAADYLMQAAIQLLMHSSDSYIREKLHNGLHRITSALYEGVRHSEQPSLYNFKSTYFPDERDA